MDAEAAKNLIETTTSCDFASYIKTYSGIATFFRTKYTADFPEADIALIGLPIDAGLTQRTGARHGPREVRTQSCNVLYFNPLTGVSPLGMCRVRDIGDVPVPSAFNLEQMIDEIFAFYRKLHAADVVPLTVGGDHSITFPIIKVLGASEPLGLVHIDAHLDTAESMSARRCIMDPRSRTASKRVCWTPNAPCTSVSAIPTSNLKSLLRMRLE
jgi:arginase family enzyme